MDTKYPTQNQAYKCSQQTVVQKSVSTFSNGSPLRNSEENFDRGWPSSIVAMRSTASPWRPAMPPRRLLISSRSEMKRNENKIKRSSFLKFSRKLLAQKIVFKFAKSSKQLSWCNKFNGFPWHKISTPTIRIYHFTTKNETTKNWPKSRTLRWMVPLILV